MEDQRDNPNIIGSEIIIYQTEDGYTKIDVKFEDDELYHISTLTDFEFMNYFKHKINNSFVLK